jgi:hypothetical protein
MAKPIKDTPVLTGKDAENFRKELRQTCSRHSDSYEAENRRIEKNYKLMVSISNGAFY